MAANDEFPRGWTLTNEVPSPSNPSVSLPATPGISHVVDEIYFEIVTIAANAVANAPAVQISLDGGVTFTLIAQAALNGGNVSRDSASFPGPFIAPAGQGVVINLTAALPTSYRGTIVAHGHDI